jgi:uncharacterized membrane protein YesL
MKLFSYEGGLMRFFNRLFDLMILTILWTISCIPIFTIGAATTALYDTTMTLTKRDVSLFKYYKESFRKFFKPATICWLIYVVIGFIIGIDYMAFYYNWPDRLGIVRIITALLIITLIFSMVMCFPIICTFAGNIREYLFNAFAISFMYAPLTLLMILIYFGFIYVGLQMFMLLCLLLILGHGVVAYINSYILRFIFRKYLPETDVKY